MRLKVKDNWVGIPEDLDLKNSNSLGLELVKALSKQISGTINITRNKGTTTEIICKCEKNNLPVNNKGSRRGSMTQKVNTFSNCLT